MIKVKNLSSARWKDYRNLRLEALRKDPIAFGSSYEEEINLPESEWRKRIKNTLFAMDGNKAVGMVVHVLGKKQKTKHIANIFGVYVNKKYRGLGIGKKLIEGALFQIRKDRNIIKIDLTVNPKQKEAVKLYKKYGFNIVGVLKKDLFVDKKFYDEVV